MALSDITSKIPDLGIDTGQIFGALTWLAIITVLGIIVGITTWIILSGKKFNIKVIVFEKISGRFEQTGSYKAMIQTIGDAGDTVLFIKKIKKFVPTPSIQTGRNVYWFFIRKDREWINAGIEDFDEKSEEMNVYFLDKEMRYARAALQKNLKERYAKLSFLEKYGGLIVWTTLCLIIIVGFVLFMDKMIEITGAVDVMVQTGAEQTEIVLKAAEGVINKLDNVCGGSGYRPA